MHAFEASLAYGRTAAEARSFRDSYLQIILSGGSLPLVLDDVLRLFRNRLRQALRLLIQTLGEEIDSSWASMEPDYLHLIRQQLHEAGTIANVLDECEKLSARLRDHEAMRLDDAVQLTRDITKVAVQAWPLSMKFTQLAEKYVGPRYRRRLRFLGGTLAIVRGLPDGLFADDAARERLFDAAQEALDQEAEHEEL
jgi:type III secretion system TyeA family effector delivery regulator